MKAPVGLLSDRTVLRSKMEGLCPDKFRVVELSRVYHTLPTNTTAQKTPMLTSEDAVHGSFCYAVTAYCYLLKVSSFSRPSLLATQMLATASPTTFREVTSISMGRLMARIRE